MKAIDRLLLASSDTRTKPFRQLLRHAKVSLAEARTLIDSDFRDMFRAEPIRVRGHREIAWVPTYKGVLRKAVLESAWRMPVDARTCPHLWTEAGFGLAGGGYGPYEYCVRCSSILNKTQELDDGDH